MPGLLNLNIEDQPLGLPFTEFSDNAFIQNNNLPWPISSSAITASFLFVLFKIRVISSPPYLHAKSVERDALLKICATCFKTQSPDWCP